MDLGVNIAIFDDNGHILLTQREDFEVWCLPGGGVDEGETPYDAAIREAQEETGLLVRPIALVGVYSYPAWFEGILHILTFTAERVGGEWRQQADEVLDMRYFALDALPADMLVGQKERIMDASRGIVGKVQTEQRVHQLEHTMTRRELYAMRDASGLGRKGFYQRYFPPLKPDQINIQIDGVTRTE